ncbi:MAG: serine--tRNA ligase [Flavobacteriales bacterium]|jgi:seryl-tRNA synthetase|nr:serine--tRNA ligase [Flavobacteriales bacterium]MDP4717097.1 serine--tRNA ligase [Flavobacteriales bacterium]MDP4731702.1 serine--tRNA ligase [Flavobacteriales bacterium]MDP4819075.1 serine--tRNA ligase [Flavobacteriales bacterium]MDP4951580.1 serine--tRNA ligase [Flavobacteriales bacterium]
MLQVPYLRENTEKALTGLAKRNKDFSATVQSIISVDESRRKLQNELDNLLAESNKISKTIGDLFKEGKREEADGMKVRTTEIKEECKGIETNLSQLEEELKQLLYQVPNVPHESVVFGKGAEENEVVYSSGDVTSLGESKLPHWELCEKHKLIDFELGVKITGAGFPVYIGKGARLQRALINFFLEEAQKAGYTEHQVPHMVNEASGYGTGQLPDKEGQMYHVGVDDLYLIPTAEVPLTNLYRDVLLKEEQLPIKLTGYTPCFRREAGSYGKDVRGLNRLHQFDKVEIVQLSKQEDSYALLEDMVNHVKGLLNKLELPFRILRLCGGDMGFTSSLTYDFEVYSAAQERWLEVSSTSNFETFQANRLKCRYKGADGKTQLVHTLNGSALALPRIVAALLENHQDENGVRIPHALVPYCGFERI